MAILSLNFEVPDTKAIDIEALKAQITAFYNVVVEMPSVLKKEHTKSWTEEFRGKWKDDNMSAEDLVREIRKNRMSSTRKTVDL